MDQIEPRPSGADPAEIEPTDNSTGDLVDLERVEEVEEQARSGEANR